MPDHVNHSGCRPPRRLHDAPQPVGELVLLTILKKLPSEIWQKRQ